jgi:transposase InsO family protein
VAALLADLEVTRSHSRPRVSNDNPYSEALFKTLKYGPEFPERFGSLSDARQFKAVLTGSHRAANRSKRLLKRVELRGFEPLSFPAETRPDLR